MPEIKLYTKDIENIANNRRQGGGSHTILEVCLARKVLELQKTIKEINDRNNGIFDTIYQIHSIINRKYGSQIIQRTMNDVTASAKSTTSATNTSRPSTRQRSSSRRSRKAR